MSITINTSDYTKTKAIEIDGHKLNIRPMSSAETISLNNLSAEMRELQVSGKGDEAFKLLDELSEMYFGLYDDSKLAKKLLQPLPYDAWFDIYGKVFNGGDNA